MNIYLAAPLFTKAEQSFNWKLAKKLQRLGHRVFVPQDMCKGHTPKNIFAICENGIKKSDCVVAVLDGSDVDSGTAWEVGQAYGKIPVFGLRTDFRKTGDEPVTGVNLMLAFSCRHVFSTVKTLVDALRPKETSK